MLARKLLLLTAAAIVVAAFAFATLPLRTKPVHTGVLRSRPATPARVAFEGGIDSLIGTLDSLANAVPQAPRERQRQRFREARRAYKRVETLLALYGPTVAAELNGPLPEESEDGPAGPLGAPAGFAILEDAIFSHTSPGRDSLHATLAAMRGAVTQFRGFTPLLAVNDSAVFVALRLELARVVTLGLSGFETERDAIPEAADALEGARLLVRTAVLGAAVDSTLVRAVAYLRGHSEFQTFDRLEFIVGYANPVWQAVAAARAHLPPNPVLRLWRTSSASLFQPGAFDPRAFAPDFAPPSSPQLVALGAALFREPRLSGPGTRSCTFCHDPARAFTDGRPTSPALTSTLRVRRNTPTLWNTAFEPRLFADGRANSLEHQAEIVLASPAEMGGNETLAAGRLATDSAWRQAFARAYGTMPDSAVTPRALRCALAAYVRSLRGLNSRFDRATRGDTLALSPDERLGFTLFMGKAHCATCHFVPLFNGNMPPEFASSEPEIIGVPTRPVVKRATLDPDSGRGGFDNEPTHRFAFRVPTLRNIALTAPYMHNGRFATLEQVIDFYNRGGGEGVGARVPGQTLPAKPLHLTRTEQRQLIAFLGALTDTVPD
ncbi:MAG TPA: cytochrome c peroxidase [Gemmatimonadales bacterium]|nr:cytochrome c peroxidase [Gemmatimonadales bacterium]